MTSSLLMRVSVVLLLVGLCFGIEMGARQDFTLAPAHAHLNLLGFVLPFVAGLYYRLVPAAERSRLAKTQAWLAIIGAIVMPAGIAAELSTSGHQFEPVIIAGSLIVLVAAALFALIVFRTSTQPA